MVKGLLKDGGYIAGSVPNRESFFVKELCQKIYTWSDNPPHHFLRFSKSSLQKSLQIKGFTEVEVFKTDYPFVDLFPFIEKKIFGNLDKVKIMMKSIIIGDRRKAKLLIDDLVGQNIPKEKVLVLKMLKLFRNLIVLPFSIPYITKLKENGLYLYFQAKILLD